MPIKKRTPKDRHFQITPAALEAFRLMEATNTDEEWSHHHSTLHTALQLMPWEWPAFAYPDEPCPYPARSHAAEHWQTQRDLRPEAFELYRELVKASKAQKCEQN